MDKAKNQHKIRSDRYNRHYVVCVSCKKRFIRGYKWEYDECPIGKQCNAKTQLI